jgi:hypothetical protein
LRPAWATRQKEKKVLIHGELFNFKTGWPSVLEIIFSIAWGYPRHPDWWPIGAAPLLM